MDITDEDMDIALALQYWYKTGSKEEEVIKFNEKEFIDKAAVEKKNSVPQKNTHGRA